MLTTLSTRPIRKASCASITSPVMPKYLARLIPTSRHNLSIPGERCTSTSSCPNLAVLDAYQGTQGNGPTSGTGIPTPQQLAVVSPDWLAADRIGLTLMGTNVYQVLNHRADDGYAMPFPACLNYLWQVGLGEWDDRNIHVTGDIGDMAGNSLVGNANVYNYMANDYQTAGYETASISKTPREGTIINPVV